MDEFHIPDSGLEGSVELRVPAPSSPRPTSGCLTPMPSNMILYPRRMLYVDAVLYLLIASASLGLGYLLGRGGGGGGPSKAAAGDKADAAIQNRVPVEGRVMLAPLSGSKKQGDAGAVVIILPADKTPSKTIAALGLRPAAPPPGPDDAAVRSLAELGGASAKPATTAVSRSSCPRRARTASSSSPGRRRASRAARSRTATWMNSPSILTSPPISCSAAATSGFHATCGPT